MTPVCCRTARPAARAVAALPAPGDAPVRRPGDGTRCEPGAEPAGDGRVRGGSYRPGDAPGLAGGRLLR
ncbi:hypothetical protein SLI_0502 [Streptomyces lividans 1326]|uniref:Uncharacterized protein n=1 Tax=Streptomyces lividans 1326 TaxID=1200984 RepID=A0A7U9HA33_STRLI|nr:hypothetical protein SLI_0502 [Streptomyces lividans 1326]